MDHANSHWIQFCLKIEVPQDFTLFTFYRFTMQVIMDDKPSLARCPQHPAQHSCTDNCDKTELIYILFDSDVCTWIPHLGTFLTVPSKWEDIVPSHKILRNLQQILDSPWGHWQVNLGPHWTLRRCSLSDGDQISLHPVVRWKFLIKHLGIDPLLVSCCISDFKQRKSSHFYKLP